MRRRWDVSRPFHGTYELSPFRGLSFVSAFFDDDPDCQKRIPAKKVNTMGEGMGMHLTYFLEQR